MPFTLGIKEIQEVCIIAPERTGLVSLCYTFMLGLLTESCGAEVLHKTGDAIFIQDKAGFSYTSLYATDYIYNHRLVII